nr:unnamed protein product [Spirometra erinaceieuropaei]
MFDITQLRVPLKRTVVLLNLALCFAEDLVNTDFLGCLNGGTRVTSDGRSFCQCASELQTGPRCEITQINFEEIEIPLKLGANISLSLPLLISFDIVSRDYVSTGKLLSLHDHNGKLVLDISIVFGRLKVQSQTVDSSLPTLSDNVWHHVDIVFLQTGIQLHAFIIFDFCASRQNCGQDLTLESVMPSQPTLVQLSVGGRSNDGNRLRELALSNIVVNSKLVDVTDATASRPVTRGCKACEFACGKNGDRKCGPYGVCRNPWTATERYSCFCRVGYQPDVASPSTTTSPTDRCTQESPVWTTTSHAVMLPFPASETFAIQMSIRTRSTDFVALQVDPDYLSFFLQNGTPTLAFANTVLEIPNVNGSDGDWHHYRVSITPRIHGFEYRLVQFAVDELWDDNHKFFLVDTNLPEPKPHLSLLIGAKSSCLQDVRFEVPTMTNIAGQQYPLGNADRFKLVGLQPGCPNEDLCRNRNPCEGNQQCIPEWQSYRCVCPDGLELMSTPNGMQCVQTTCDPNPCRNLGICRPSDTLFTIDNISMAVTCSCPAGWTGSFCEIAAPVKAVHMAWWSLPAAFMVLIIALWTTFCWFWWKKRRNNSTGVSCQKTNAQGSRVVNEPVLNETFKHETQEYQKSADPEVLKIGNDASNSTTATVPLGRSQPDSETLASMDNLAWDPPEDRFLTLDQPLQYAFEGYDTSPTATYVIAYEIGEKK